jgi:hypothetical protein
MISMVTRYSRATPLVWRAVDKDTLKDHRNLHEGAVLQRLHEVLPEGTQATLLADRGFGDQKLFEFLEHVLRFDYVIRFCDNTTVTSTSQKQRKAAAWVGKSGRARTLRNATFITDNCPVNTIVCARQRHEGALVFSGQ